MWVYLDKPKSEYGKKLGYYDIMNRDEYSYNYSHVFFGWCESIRETEEYWVLSDTPIIRLSKKSFKCYVLYYSAMVYFANGNNFVSNRDIYSRKYLSDAISEIREINSDIVELKNKKNDIYNELKSK